MTALNIKGTESAYVRPPRKLPFSAKCDVSKQAYRTIGKMVRKHLGEHEILRRWNNTAHGKFCKLTTIDRWLNPGPATKNLQFEPFVIALHSELLLKTSESSEKILRKSMDKLQTKLDCDQFTYNRHKATAASLLAYYQHDEKLSSRQRELVSELVNS